MKAPLQTKSLLQYSSLDACKLYENTPVIYVTLHVLAAAARKVAASGLLLSSLYTVLVHIGLRERKESNC